MSYRFSIKTLKGGSPHMRTVTQSGLPNMRNPPSELFFFFCRWCARKNYQREIRMEWIGPAPQGLRCFTKTNRFTKFAKTASFISFGCRPSFVNTSRCLRKSCHMFTNLAPSYMSLHLRSLWYRNTLKDQNSVYKKSIAGCRQLRGLTNDTYMQLIRR